MELLVKAIVLVLVSFAVLGSYYATDGFNIEKPIIFTDEPPTTTTTVPPPEHNTRFIIMDINGNTVFWVNNSGWVNITDFLEVSKNITIRDGGWQCFNTACTSYIYNNGTHLISK